MAGLGPSVMAYLSRQNQFGWQLYPNRPGVGCRTGAEIEELISIRTRGLFFPPDLAGRNRRSGFRSVVNRIRNVR